MKAIILIGEEGDSEGKSNALLKLCGLTLLERNLYTLKEAGVNEFLIICGSHYNVIKDYIEKNGLDADFNMILLNKIEDIIHLTDNKFLIFDVNIIFNANIVKNLIAKANKRSFICIDSSPKYTKVDIPDEKYLNVGIFLSSKSVLRILKSFFQKSLISKQVINKSNIGIYDLKGGFWYKINTQRDLKRAEDMLLSQKSPNFDSEDFVSRFIRKTFAKFFVKYLVRTPVSPNQVTLFTFLLFISAALFFSIGDNTTAGILVLLALIFDHCDGAIARLKFKTSKYGFWLDNMSDIIGFYSVILGATIGLYIKTHAVLSWIVGMLVFFWQIVIFGDKLLSNYASININTHTLSSIKKENFFGKLLNFYKIKRRLWFGWGVQVLLISLGALLNILLIIFLVFICTMCIPWLIRFIIYSENKTKI